MSAPTLKLNPPFRAGHIGSFKRPEKLLAKRKELDEGKCTAAELKPVEDEAIRGIVQLQREVGIKSITDGEFRRYVVCYPLSGQLWTCATDTCSSMVSSTTWTA